jgi:uncharacterized protein YbaR (Trm112 family)
MHETMLDLLRCPFCGTRLSLVDNAALVRSGGRIESGVLGCECCAFPVVAGIPVMLADEPTRDAMHRLEAGEHDAALFALLGLDQTRASAFRHLLASGPDATYEKALAILSRDAEGTCFLYRFSDPTFVMIEALLRAIAEPDRTRGGPVLDICGGTGHLTRVLSGLNRPAVTVLADLYFWKLWLARRFMVPEGEPVCCDANQPLPFARDVFSLVVLADAFPYIWHKRLLADEIARAAAADGTIVMPHLHSALGENFSAGNTLTPAAYRDLFVSRHPRLFSDAGLLSGVLEHRQVDLTRDVSPEHIGNEPSFTLVSGRPDLFRRYALSGPERVTGELRVNPLYRVERQAGSSVLTLTFPTPEYEEEFGDCRRYLPDTVRVDADLTAPIAPERLGPRGDDLRRRRIIIDAPPDYC